jgi:hypothetical protein
MVDTWTKVAQGTIATLSNATPEAIGTVAAAGDGTAASRDDHVHILGADCVGAGNIADDAVGSEHIETLSAALDCGKQELQNMLFHKSSTPPSPAVVGQMYYDTDDNQLYVCTAVS